MHLTLVSQYAFYPMHWEAFRLICTTHGARGSVVAPRSTELPLVHRQLGWVEVEAARSESFRPDVRLMPAMSKRRQQAWMCRQLDELQPDAIWVQEEPTSRLLLDVLRHYDTCPRIRIVCAVAENIFRIRWWRRWRMVRRWRRLDRMIAVASASVEGIRLAGMPAHIPADTLVAGAFGPPPEVAPLDLPLRTTSRDWVIGFAGRICAEKGWHVLLDAVGMLPREYKVALAGVGPQVDQLDRRLQYPDLAGRAHYLGLLPKADLWSFYKAVDCLAAPHRTTAKWKEQFGGVLADAMAAGIPIVGSNSGAIPEVIGPAGLIVQEGDAGALAVAIRHLRETPGLVQRLSDLGRARFVNEYAMPAYARKIARALGFRRQGVFDVAAA